MSLVSLASLVPFGTLVKTTMKEDASLIADWPLPDDLLSAHKKRITEFALGRLALQKAFAQNRIDLAPEELVFNGHQELLLVPGFRFSISHTENSALVWLADSDECEGIGVDIEPSTRKISDGVYQKLLHPKDQTTLSPIELWSAKEACFKAVAAESQTDLVVAKIFLNERTFTGESISSSSDSTGYWVQFVDAHLIHTFAWRK